MNSTDIARIAGVSRSTVSRVINNYDNVPEETKEKVLEVINKYNYVPHASAQMLAGKKNKTLGLFIVDTKDEGEGNKMAESSYFMPFTSAIIDVASRQQYNVLISMVNKVEDYRSVKDIFFNKTISAGVFIGAENGDPDIRGIIESGFKVAVIEQKVKDEQDTFSRCIVVNSDSFDGAYEAVKYLIGLGHTSIAHICGDMKQLTAISRMEGYKKAMAHSGIGIKSNLIVEGRYTEESGYKAAKELLSEEAPTAIFAANDSMALGAIRAVHEMEMKIPSDISIIGFDDIQIARYLEPALTTVRISLTRMASIAASKLIESNEEEKEFYSCNNVPVELVKRGSCRRIE